MEITAYDLLKIHRELLRCLERAGISASDHRYVDLYCDWLALAATEKKAYALAVLSERYNVSERNIIRVVGRLGRVVDMTAFVTPTPP